MVERSFLMIPRMVERSFLMSRTHHPRKPLLPLLPPRFSEKENGGGSNT
jgi:hypothetical protein